MEPGRTRPSRVVLAIGAMLAVFALLLFAPARRLDWTLGWLYLGLLAVLACANWACLLRWNPELIEQRMRFGAGTKTWDKVWAALFSPVMIAIYVVAGMEARVEVPSRPGGSWLVGLVLLVCGWALLTWSMVVNPFFEKTVRIQTERGHRVIDTGPYARVRHPGYLGFSGWLLSTPLLLGSFRAWIPVLLALVGIALRTALEDRTLRAELPGYAEYAGRVRFRLVPGVW